MIESQCAHCRGPEPDYPQIPRFNSPKIVPFARQTRASRSLLASTKELLAQRENNQVLWKMPKFVDVEHRVDSHWRYFHKILIVNQHHGINSKNQS